MSGADVGTDAGTDIGAGVTGNSETRLGVGCGVAVGADVVSGADASADIAGNSETRLGVGCAVAVDGTDARPPEPLIVTSAML